MATIPPLITPPATPTPVTATAGSQGKNWCFVVNNYTDADIQKLRDLGCDLCCQYLVFGKEIAPTTGTPHLQGNVCFRGNKRFGAVQRLLPFGANIQLKVRQSTPYQAYNYCRKDGVFEEYGIAPLDIPRGAAGGAATAEKWSLAKAAAKRGALDEIADELFIKYYSTFKRIAKDFMAKPDPLSCPCGLWIWGTTGTGKTHSVVTQHPERYIKPLNKWWDGYQGEDVVHLDELAPSHTGWIAPYLKKWADKWPFDAEVKGGAMQLRPKLIVVTSNYNMNEMGFDPADFPALVRRFRMVQKFRDQDIIVQ